MKDDADITEHSWIGKVSIQICTKNCLQQTQQQRKCHSYNKVQKFSWSFLLTRIFQYIFRFGQYFWFLRVEGIFSHQKCFLVLRFYSPATSMVCPKQQDRCQHK
jgi:hypothetical protein